MMIPKFEESIKGLTSGDKAISLFCQQKVTAERNPQAVAQLPLEMFNESGMPPVVQFFHFQTIKEIISKQ